MTVKEHTGAPLKGEEILINAFKGVMKDPAHLPELIVPELQQILHDLALAQNASQVKDILFTDPQSAQDVTGAALMDGIDSIVFYKVIKDMKFNGLIFPNVILTIGKKNRVPVTWISIKDSDTNPTFKYDIAAAVPDTGELTTNLRFETSDHVLTKQYN